MMKKLFAGLLSLITMVAMLVTNVPTAVYALNETSTPTADTVSIVSEDVTKRGMYEKHFLMSDGSYTVAVYNEPVHYDANGTWVEVDNTLQLTTNSRGASQYKTVNGITEVSFAKQFDAQLVTMNQGEYSLSWDITAVSGISNRLSATKVDAKIVPLNLTGLSSEEVKTVATKSTSTIRYNNALAQGVDLEYIVTPSKIKENIILNSPKDITSYRINLYTENLSARLLENNQIELYDADGKVIFTIHSPYMYDSAGELSEDFTLQMLPSGTGCYTISMKPNADWLSDPSRVYPVVIDPTVNASNTTQNIIDTYIREGYGVQNISHNLLYVGNYFGSKSRVYIRYSNMPSLPGGSTIRSATQKLYITTSASTAQLTKAYQITSDWSQETLTWENTPTIGTTLATNISHNNVEHYSFPCTSAVSTWYHGSPAGQNRNYGIMLQYADETIADYNALYSSEYTDFSYRPWLTLVYLPPSTAETDFVWPAPGKYFITSRWGFRYSSDRVHAGIDISCSEGTQLVAAIDGVVHIESGGTAGNMLFITSTTSNLQVRYSI